MFVVAGFFNVIFFISSYFFKCIFQFYLFIDVFWFCPGLHTPHVSSIYMYKNDVGVMCSQYCSHSKKIFLFFLLHKLHVLPPLPTSF
jgi:hypothetical protein